MRAFEMLGGGTLLPIHWGTFDLALHAWDEPPETLLGLAEKTGARVITPPLRQADRAECRRRTDAVVARGLTSSSAYEVRA